MTRTFVICACALFLVSSPGIVSAQSGDGRIQIGGQLAGVASSEFDSGDVGVGGRISWHPMPLVGVEAELNFYPGDFADDPAFSASRTEGLFGVTVGPRLSRIRPFAKLRPGFLTFSEAPEPFACILIFPPPLPCALASGTTVFALDIGGGVEFYPTDRTFVRVDAGDRAVRYPGPVFDSDREVHDEAFFSHDLRFSIGGGLRF